MDRLGNEGGKEKGWVALAACLPVQQRTRADKLPVAPDFAPFLMGHCTKRETGLPRHGEGAAQRESSMPKARGVSLGRTIVWGGKDDQGPYVEIIP